MAIPTIETALTKPAKATSHAFPDAVAFGNGFAAIYTELDQASLPKATFVQIFNATGKMLFKTRVADWGGQSPELTDLGGGKLMATWRGREGTNAAIVDGKNGKVLASKDLGIKQSDHVNEVVSLGNGKAAILVTYSDISNPFAPRDKTQVFVVDSKLKVTKGSIVQDLPINPYATKDYWQVLDRGGKGATVVYLDRSDNKIYARLIDGSGKAGKAIAVNKDKLVVPSLFDSLNQSVKAESTADGGFIVTWAGQTSKSNGYDVWTRMYDSSGKAKGAAIQVNQVTKDTQYKPDVIMLEKGNFAIAWVENSFSKIAETHFIRFFDAKGVALSGEIAVNKPPFGFVASLDTEWLRLKDGSLVELYARAGGVFTVGLPKPLIGTAKSEAFGTAKADFVIAGAGNDVLDGKKGADILSGGAGRDTLDGGDGKDVLSGDGGEDRFVFSTAPSKKNVDRILDFKAADDTIVLSGKVFSKVAKGKLAEAAFKDLDKAGAFVDADDRIIQEKGVLSYDPDGSGGAAATAFAVLENKATLNFQDFVII